MANVYYDKDADLDVIKDKVVMILGYGNQGRSQALNLRDSGVANVIIGSRKDDSWNTANDDGFPVYSIEEAVQKSDIIFMLLPDEVAPEIYKNQIEPNLKSGAALNFSSGYNITYNHIVPAKDFDVLMVAPRMIGKAVRELYLSKDGFPAFAAVHQDATGNAWKIALALAKGIGSTKKGCIEVTFNDETYLDLMAEQATWPLVYSVFTEAFKYQLEMGHPEEAVLTELYLSKEPAVMMEKAVDVGFFKQLDYHSHTSQYGQLKGFEIADKSKIREFIASQYEQIKSGQFAREWETEQEKGLPRFKELKKAALNSEMGLSEERVKSRLK